MVDVLLETLGLVAGGHQGAGLPSSGALLDPRGLGQSLVVSLHTIDHDPPLAVSVDSSPGLDVGGDRGAEVGLLHDLLQSVHAVVSVGQDVLVDLLNTLIVVLQSSLDFIGRVLRILNAPGLGVTNRALGFVIWLRLVVDRGRVVDRDWLVVWFSMVDRDWLMVRGRFMVGGSNSVWSRFMIRGSVVDHGGGVDLGSVDWGGVIHWLHWSVHCWSRGVAIHSSMVDRSSNSVVSYTMVSRDHSMVSSGDMDRSSSICISFSLD